MTKVVSVNKLQTSKIKKSLKNEVNAKLFINWRRRCKIDIIQIYYNL
jgi:hypothetical protein